MKFPYSQGSIAAVTLQFFQLSKMFGFDFEIYLTGIRVSYGEVTRLKGFDLVSLFD